LELLFSIPDPEERSSTNGAQRELDLGRWPSGQVHGKEQESQATKKEQVEQCAHSHHFMLVFASSFWSSKYAANLTPGAPRYSIETA
jgi:hypothetical protein